jgi:bacterioferritin-associated ferredoxin
MYVCICHAVTQADVEAEISAGARSEQEIGERCFAGTGCGMCVDKIGAMLRSADTASSLGIAV